LEWFPVFHLVIAGPVACFCFSFLKIGVKPIHAYGQYLHKYVSSSPLHNFCDVCGIHAQPRGLGKEAACFPVVVVCHV
jgi:hypothetical protein